MNKIYDIYILGTVQTSQGTNFNFCSSSTAESQILFDKIIYQVQGSGKV